MFPGGSCAGLCVLGGKGLASPLSDASGSTSKTFGTSAEWRRINFYFFLHIDLSILHVQDRVLLCTRVWLLNRNSPAVTCHMLSLQACATIPALEDLRGEGQGIVLSQGSWMTCRISLISLAAFFFSVQISSWFNSFGRYISSVLISL